MSASCNASLGTKSTEDVDVPPPTTKKYSIFVDVNGVKGKDATKWSSRCGHLIRCLILIGYEEWRKVDDFYKNELWRSLMTEFDITNIGPNLARQILEKKFPQYYRTVKASIRKKYLKKDGLLLPKCAALDSCPDDMDTVWWSKFIDIEYSERKKKQCKTNTENKSKNSMTHTLGRKSYMMLYDELKAETPAGKVTRAMAWKRAHENKKTGEVIPCAAEKYVLIEAAEEKQKLEAGDDGIIGLEDFENDAIAEVFGPEKKRSYCRAISSTATVKQLKFTRATKAIFESTEREDLRQFKDDIQNKFDYVVKAMSSNMMCMQQNMLQNMQQFMTQFGVNMTQRTDADSNEPLTPTNSICNLDMSNEGVGSSTRDKQSVI